MKPTRRLQLRRETLAPLAENDLAGIAGGTHIRTDCGCLTHGYTCDACDLPSLPFNTCVCQTFERLICT